MTAEKLPTSILFVCSGNTCRSPMAEYLAIGMAEQRKQKIKFASRGTSAGTYTGSGFSLGPSKDTCKLVRELYPDSLIFTHQPTSLSFKDVYNFSLILTMETRHLEEIIDKLEIYIPNLTEKVFTLKEFSGLGSNVASGGLDISDPMGGGAGGYGDLQNFKSGGAFKKSRVGFSYRSKYSADVDSSNSPNKYQTCRDEIIKSLERLFDGPRPSIKELCEVRNLEKIKMQEIKREKDICDYNELLTRIKGAKPNSDVEAELRIRDQIEDGLSPEYVAVYAVQIENLMKSRGIKLITKSTYVPYVHTGSRVYPIDESE
jgi:protein-tyrosine-phosphatase